MANKDNEYDYHHDYYHRGHYKGGNLALLVLFALVMMRPDRIWVLLLLALVPLAIVLFCAGGIKLDNWARKHSSPKVRKTRNWIIGIFWFILGLVIYLLIFQRELVEYWVYLASK